MLLHRQRIIGAAFDRGVVRDDHDLAAGDAANAGDDARAMDRLAIHAVRGKRRKLEKRRAEIEESQHALARQELAARGVARARFLVAAERGFCSPRFQHAAERGHGGGIRFEVGGMGVEFADDFCHGRFLGQKVP
jgi:hypothetical protein